MTTEIVLTLDFFLRDWNDASPDRAQLWACVQPHVIKGQGAAEFTSLEEWIRDSATGAAFSYRLTSPATTGEPVPINFCDNVNVALDVERAAGTTRIANDRRRGVGVKDSVAAADIARVNREIEDERTQKNMTPNQSKTVDIVPGPFAAGYNSTLRTALSGQPAQIEQFEHILKLAFWGGTRRYIPTSAINTGDVSVMQLPESDASLLVTNLHSLNGLLFLLGTRRDLAALNAIEDIRIVLDADGTVLSVDGHDADAATSIRAFFSKLTPAIVLSDPPRAAWDRDVATRVYAIDNFAGLSHEPKLGPWYRRQNETTATAQRRLLSKMKRFVVRFDEHRPEPAPLPDWSKLSWAVWDSFQVTIAPYRRFPAARSANGPLQLQPAPGDRERFEVDLRTDPQMFLRGDARLVDAQGVDHAASVAFLGSFDYPWDRAGGELAPASCPPSESPTVLFHGPMNLPESLLLLVRRRDANDAPITLVTDRTGDDDSFGPRWQRNATDVLPPLHFTHLECVDIPEPAQAGHLVPALAFERDLRFEFAQAASSIEGRLTATFPHGGGVPLTDPASVDPAEEFAHDLVNHNAANIYAKWDGRPLEVDAGKQPGRKIGHLNPYGEIYPVSSTSLSGAVVYDVPFRHRLTPSAPPPDRTSPRSVRLHFRDMYARIGATRTLDFDFEHTYGTQIALPIDGGGPVVSGLSSHYDFDLLTPPEVTRMGEPGTGCPATATDDFMTVSYRNNANREVLQFALHTKWLLSDYAVCGNGSMRETHIAAWRAVAELAYASEVRVTGLFRRFDFHSAIRSCNADGIAAGLAPVPEFENRVWVVPPAKLATRCRELLDRETFDDVLTFEVVLTEPTETPKVFQSCNVIEIFLEASRDAGRLARTQAWHFAKPRPQTRTDSTFFEPLTNRTENEDARLSFTSYLDSIATKRAVVRPAFAKDQQGQKQEAEAARFRRLLGNGVSQSEDALARRNADPGAWILPEGLAVPASGSVVASVCPVTFRAPALHPLLGPLTFELVRKYFRLLQTVIDCDFFSATTLQPAEWRTHFELLAEAARALSPADSLFDAVLDSVMAVPDVDPAAGIDPEVREVAVRLRDTASEAAVAFRRWIEHRLWREPSMFADAKALLFHRLRPSSGTTAPPEFFALDSTRRISEAALHEPSHATFRQSLVDLHETSWFGVGEVLDDVRYDNDFTFEDYSLQSFEGVVSEHGTSPDPAFFVPLDGPLHIPQAGQPVRLASRSPVIPPTHLFSGRLPEMQQGSPLRQLRGRRLSLDALKHGNLADAVANEPAVILAGATSDLVLAPKLDQYVLSSLFAIYGDEETATGWRSAFDNDELRIHFRVGNDTITAMANPPAASDEVAELFSKIAEASHMQRADVAPKLVLSNDALAFVAGILRGKDAVLPANPVPSLTIQRRDGAGDCTSLKLRSPASDALAGRVQAFLLAASPEGIAPCDESVPRQTFVLMINVLAPVWERAAIGLVHARNAREGFAPDLAQVTQVVFPDRFHQPFLTVNGPGFSVPRRAHSVSELVAAFQFSDAHAWENHDVSVTVSHLQRRSFPAAIAPGQQIAVHQESAFPLANARQEAHAGEVPIVEFHPDYDDFLLDFQWSSGTNLQFYRVNECRVRVT